MIKKKKLTRSGLELSEIGIGCATLAFDPAKEAVAAARAMLAKAVEAGVTYFDTSPYYGRGLSERLVGDALRTNTDVILSSKVGRLLRPDAAATTHMPFSVDFDYTYEGIMRSVEHSYQRLGMEKIDILFVHDLGSYTHGDADAAQFANFFEKGGYRALDELRRAGDVTAIGLGVNEVEICQRALEHGDFDLFLLAGRHTLLERTGAQSLFENCAKVDTDIVVGGPFNSGMLVGGSTYNYLAIPEDMAARHRELLKYCKIHAVEIGAAALQFPLRHAQVKSVITGPKNIMELDKSLAWANATICEEFWLGLETLDDSI